MNHIGGYFGLEKRHSCSRFHQTFALKNGRAALNFIIQTLQPQKIHLPFYACDALLEPIRLHKIPFQFYAINEQLELTRLPKLEQGEYLIYINYLDLKRDYSQELSDRYGESLILDSTQAFFHKGNGLSWLFNSARKFFGVPDGSYLYCPQHLNISLPDLPSNKNPMIDHLILRDQGKVQQGYEAFKLSESLQDSQIMGISEFSADVLSHLDYEDVTTRRRNNYRYYEQKVADSNLISLELNDEAVPYFYPYLLEGAVEKELFFQHRIYIPTFWNECLHREVQRKDYPMAYRLTEDLLLLPIDHRYEKEDIDRVIGVLKSTHGP